MPGHTDSHTGLRDLERQVARELELLAYPRHPWVPERRSEDGQVLTDVLVVGAGQGGLVSAFGLQRQRIERVRIIDREPCGDTGPWLRYARMPTLRSPKELTGPDLGIPSLTFQAWYEAQHGAAGWSALVKIHKQDWVRYLEWYREVLAIPVEFEVELAAIEGHGQHVLATLRTARGEQRVVVRKLVLANGIEGAGCWWTPPQLRQVPGRFWAHTSEDIDMRRLAGKRVAVLGAGASAFDNAACALEHGAHVHLYCRRAELQRVQPFKCDEVRRPAPGGRDRARSLRRRRRCPLRIASRIRSARVPAAGRGWGGGAGGAGDPPALRKV